MTHPEGVLLEPDGQPVHFRTSTLSDDDQRDRVGFTLRSLPRRPPDVDPILEAYQRRQDAKNRPGLVSSAFRAENIVNASLRLSERMSAEDDDDFVGVMNLPEEDREKLFSGIPPNYWWSIHLEANSLAQAHIIAGQYRQLVEAEDILSEAGFTGFMARMAAAFIDPAAIGLSAMTAGLAGAVSHGPKAFRLAKIASGSLRRTRVAKVAFFSGVENAAIESFVAADNPTRSSADVIYAGMAGVVIGGGLEANETGRPENQESV